MFWWFLLFTVFSGLLLWFMLYNRFSKKVLWIPCVLCLVSVGCWVWWFVPTGFVLDDVQIVGLTTFDADGRSEQIIEGAARSELLEILSESRLRKKINPGGASEYLLTLYGSEDMLYRVYLSSFPDENLVVSFVDRKDYAVSNAKRIRQVLADAGVLQDTPLPSAD